MVGKKEIKNLQVLHRCKNQNAKCKMYMKDRGKSRPCKKPVDLKFLVTNQSYCKTPVNYPVILVRGFYQTM